MGSYGRNFEFRVTPTPEQRPSRYKVPATGTRLPIGTPVKVANGASLDAQKRLEVALATGAQAPKSGLCGIVVYEYAPSAYAGTDPALTTYSDMDLVPLGAGIQLVSGETVKVCFSNTVDRTFATVRDYAGRIMVGGVGATPTVAVGDYLTPGTGDDDNGYWAETAVAASAWLVVTAVDHTRLEVEARMLF